MDAVTFLEERNRMCKSHKSCIGCPAYDRGFCRFNISIAGDKADSRIKIVERWSAAHPRKTRQSVFLEQWPSVELDRNGIINILSCKVDSKQYPFNGKNCCKLQACSECRREFWMQEVE